MHSIFLAIILAFSLSPQKLCGETETRSADAGETVHLGCDIAHQTQTLWFGQRSGEPPFLSMSVSRKSYEAGELFTQFILGGGPRLAGEFDAATNSVRLKIENATASDAALYYCASMRRGGLYFGNGTKIVISGAESGDPPSPRAPDCVFCCVQLAFVSLVCAVVCTMGLCCCLRQVLKKKSQVEKGLPVSSKMKTRPHRSAT